MTSKTTMRSAAQLGLSLVELMVAMVIGLIVMIVVYQMFVASEGTRRTAIAGNDAQMSAAIAMSALQDEIRNAGYGLNSAALLDCRPPPGALGAVQAYDARFGGSAFTFPLVPVTIAQGADNNALGVGKDPDQITVVYSDLPYPTVPATLQAGMISGTADILVTSRYGVTPGNVLIVAEPGRGCAMVEVTGTPTTPPSATIKATVRHGVAQYTDQGGVTRTVRFNGPAGIPVFTTKAQTYNFGTNPSIVTFSVQNNQLMMSNLLGTANQALVDGVVSLQAEYGVGVDTTVPTDGFADIFDPNNGQGAWQRVAPANPGLVVAVRLAVLTRGNLMEAKDKGTGLCNATSAASPELVWAGGAFDVTGTVDWDCYRYKKFEMVVPLRNMIWIPT